MYSSDSSLGIGTAENGAGARKLRKLRQLKAPRRLGVGSEQRRGGRACQAAEDGSVMESVGNESRGRVELEEQDR